MAAAKPFVPALDAEDADPDKGSKYSFPRDLVGYGRNPPKANWPGDAKIAVSFVINYEEVATDPPSYVRRLTCIARARNDQC
jgi:hypothetical protein